MMKNFPVKSIKPWFLILAFIFFSCQAEEPKQYLFLGHPYDWAQGNRVDPRLEKLDYSQFAQIWLGGDVCSKTTEDPQTLHYLDSLFDFGSGKVHWTLGNHDIQFGHVNYITERTNRPEFYTTFMDGICLMVLNTNLFWWFEGNPPQVRCAEKQRQWKMIQAVVDTLEQASHLIVLHHLALLNELKLDKEGKRIDKFNINAKKIRANCDPESDFTEIIYPKLAKLQKKGIQVLFIGGDFGMQAKEFAYRTKEGVWLLGSGINNSVNRKYAPEYVTNFDPDKVLILKHQPKRKKISWEFKLLNELLENR